MKEITSNVNGIVLTINFIGRVDTNNAGAVQKECDRICAETTHDNVILDFDQLDYVSSAGLRVVLKLRKQNPDLEIINANSEVYEILDITGFTEMIPVQKAYRKFCVDGCKVIGQGANGKVYRYDEETIIKVYHNPDALPEIKRDQEMARKAFILDLPTAIPYDVVQIGDKYGSVYELLNADPFTNLIAKEPEKLPYYTQLSVDLLKKIHSTSTNDSDIPDMKEIALDWAAFLKDYLPKEYGDKLYNLVSAVPVKKSLLHGDYHMNNIMMQDGEVLLIDLDTLCYGHPVFELGSVFNCYRGFGENDPTITERFLGITQEQANEVWELTKRMYLGTDDPEKIQDMENKAKLIGYTRLMRRSIRRNGLETEEGRRDIETFKQHILEILDTIDTLEF